MVSVNAAFMPVYPAWYHTAPATVAIDYAKNAPDADVNSIVRAAESHDARIASWGGKALGTLWVPSPQTGAVEGYGFVEIVEADFDVNPDDFLTNVRKFKPARGEKIMTNSAGRIPDTRHGPAGVHLVSKTTKADPRLTLTADCWVFTGPRSIVRVSTTHWDPTNFDPVADAISEFVIRMQITHD